MPIETTGERIRAVRQLMGLSQDELAGSASVSTTLISYIENGMREATDPVIEAIAHATATPIRFFQVSAPNAPLDSLRFRKLATARQGETKRAKALFDEAFRVVSELLSEEKYPRPDLPMAKGDVSQDDIESLAAAAREALQLSPDGPVSHLTRSCERGGVPVVPLTLFGSDDAALEPVGHFGVSCWSVHDDLALIGYFTGGPGDRNRYTLAHELGHLVLHNHRRTTANAEDEANRFAGALLLPKTRAAEIFSSSVVLSDLMQLKRHWGVSIQALIMRGANLGLIDERRKTSLFRQLSARGWRKSEPVTVHHEEPALVWRLLERRYGKPVSYVRLADKLGLHAVILRSIAPSPTRPSKN